MAHQTDWNQLEYAAATIMASRWPHAKGGITALLPHLKRELAFEQALIYIAHGTLIIEFPSPSIPIFHIEVPDAEQYKLYWYGANPLDVENDVTMIVPLDQVVPTILAHATE